MTPISIFLTFLMKYIVAIVTQRNMRYSLQADDLNLNLTKHRQFSFDRHLSLSEESEQPIESILPPISVMYYQTKIIVLIIRNFPIINPIQNFIIYNNFK